MNSIKYLRFTTILFFISTAICTVAVGQGNLRKQVTIGQEKKITISALLVKISVKQDFSFAYNNNTIPADSVVEVSGYRGTLFDLLQKLLGDNYEFKEVPGYVVLRNASGRLNMTAEIDRDPGRQMLIKGYISDAGSHNAIRGVSVFEENLLVSAITDDRGYFELRIKNWNSAVVLTARKDNFRDTSLHILSDVIVTGRAKTPVYRYYPDGGVPGVEHNRFARFFLGSKQLIQSLNIGNFFASSPYQVSVIPGLSSHGLYNSQVVDHFSVNMLGGYTAGIDGFEVGGLFNINRRDVQYFQAAGIFNFVGGNVRGIQVAGIYNQVLNKASGFQVAGFANKTPEFSGGVQIAGFVNTGKIANGALHLAGVANVFEETRGVTFAGFGNLASKSSGIQMAGIFNKGGQSTGSQFSSFLNLAHRVHGIQVGLINIADTSDYPFGIVNWIKTGEKSITLQTDESLFTQIDLRTGGRVLYSILGIGYKTTRNISRYQLNLGIGIHLINHPGFYLNSELTSDLVTGSGLGKYQRNSLKLIPGFKITRRIGIFAGPSLTASSSDGDAALPESGWVLHRSYGDVNRSLVSAGLSGGLQYSW